MVSRFEIVNQEYIEELKDKSENENTKNMRERVQKVGEWKNNLQENLENDVLQ